MSHIRRWHAIVCGDLAQVVVFVELEQSRHMREGSVTVASGDTVIAGQALGRCGNSGNTSEPHLHFQLQNTSDLTDGEGLPAFFEDYFADNDPVERGEPVAGQFIRAE